MHGLVEFGRGVEVDDVDVAVCSSDDEELVFDVHCIHALLALDRGDWGLLSQVPVLDGLVPRACDEEGRTADGGIGNHVAAADGSIVGSNLGGSGRTGSEIQKASSFVGTGTDDLGSVLGNEKESRVSFGHQHLSRNSTNGREAYRGPTAA